MKKFLLLAFVVSFSAVCAVAQDRKTADETLAGFKRMYNSKQTDSVFFLFSDEVKQKLPLDKTRAMLGQVYAQMGELRTTSFIKQEGTVYYYRTAFANTTTQLVLMLDKAGKLTTFRFVPDNAEEKKKDEPGAYEIKMQSGKATIRGTLTVPDSKEKVPVVLLIAGSGPTDRNGNGAQDLKTDAYKQLADSFRQHGIACLRYDKRGIGESASTQTEEELRFGDMVNDAVGLVKLLRDDKRLSSVYIAGHSEGSLVGMLAAEKSLVNGYISIAGIADPAYKVISNQLKSLSEGTRKQADVIMDSIKRGHPVKNIPEDLEMLFRPSVQPYMLSWFKYDPSREIARLKMPVLIIQGKKDIQVEVGQAIGLSKAKPGAKLVLLSEMTHTLKDAVKNDTTGQATYLDPAYPLSQGLVNALLSFIK